MMSALTRKHDEVKRLLELYTLYKDSDDDWRRRKAHIDLDRFLMENREAAILCMEQVLADEIHTLVNANKKPRAKRSWLSKMKLWRRDAAPLEPTKEISQ